MSIQHLIEDNGDHVVINPNGQVEKVIHSPLELGRCLAGAIAYADGKVKLGENVVLSAKDPDLGFRYDHTKGMMVEVVRRLRAAPLTKGPAGRVDAWSLTGRNDPGYKHGIDTSAETHKVTGALVALLIAQDNRIVVPVSPKGRELMEWYLAFADASPDERDIMRAERAALGAGEVF